MLSKTLKNLRKRKEITQAELARTLGITQQAVARWESDKSTPDIETLKQLSSFFGVSTDYMLGYNNTQRGDPLSAEQEKLLRDFDSLSADGQNLLKELVASLRMTHSRKSSNVIQNNINGHNFYSNGGNNVIMT